ncbi:MAG: GrpB family protein [Gemmatimonadota bacterium]
MRRVEVRDYDPEWPLLYEHLRARIWPAVSDVAITIEHVGSTAVPGLAAKPIIDLDVVAVPALINECTRRLEGLGYRHQGDLGIPGREAFAEPPGSPRHHLYLCSSDSEALANHLTVRAALRASSSEARAYGELKKALADTFAEDRDAYTAGKTDFLLALLARAGFSAAALADIRGMNAR